MTGNDDAEKPKLGETVGDRATALLKGSVGALPIAGSFAAEVLGQLIPNQRLLRIEGYIRFLDARLDLISGEQMKIIESSSEHLDLFEEGVHKAIRAITDERRQQIAKIVADGLSDTKRKAVDKKRILQIFSDLEDDDLVLLLNYVMIDRLAYDEFAEKHSYLLESLHATNFSEPHLRERAALRASIEAKLERFDLVRETLISRTSGVSGMADQMIEGDKRRRITELGRMILHEASLIGDNEYSLPRTL